MISSVRRSLLVSAVLLLAAATVRAESFASTNLADEALQSRSFSEDTGTLLRAALQVTQDLKFLVTEARLNPGLLVAAVPPCARLCAERTLTIAVGSDPLQADLTQVRLSLEQRPGAGLRAAPPQNHADFYQTFFTHLRRELALQENLP